MGFIIKHHALKTSAYIVPPFLILVLVEGEWSTSCPAALPPGNSPQNPQYRKVDGPQSWSKRYWENKNLLRLPGIKPRPLGLPDRSLHPYSLCLVCGSSETVPLGTEVSSGPIATSVGQRLILWRIDPLSGRDLEKDNEYSRVFSSVHPEAV
jgi:hypothetical protein